MWKVAIKYAVLAGIFESILFHVSRSFEAHPLIDLSHLFFDVVILSIFILVAQYEFKNYQQKGYLHFWQGMSLGFLVYTPAIFIFGAFLYYYFDDALIAEYKKLALQLLDDKKDMFIEQFGLEYIQSQKDEINNITKSALILSAIVKKLIAGFFVTPAISILLRKKPN